jgi:hypothetical protein
MNGNGLRRVSRLVVQQEQVGLLVSAPAVVFLVCGQDASMTLRIQLGDGGNGGLLNEYRPSFGKLDFSSC